MVTVSSLGWQEAIEGILPVGATVRALHHQHQNHLGCFLKTVDFCESQFLRTGPGIYTFKKCPGNSGGMLILRSATPNRKPVEVELYLWHLPVPDTYI